MTTIRFKYIGNGAHLPGVPSRDITDDDFRPREEGGLRDAAKASIEEHMQLGTAPDLEDEERARLIASRIYEAATPAGKGARAAAAEPPAAEASSEER